jgi:hypothetical protein
MVTTVVVENRQTPDDGTRRRERNAPSRRAAPKSVTQDARAAEPKAPDAQPANGKPNGKYNGVFHEPLTTELSDSERYEQISRCAYYRAEARGFAPGHMWDDWLAAEREVTARLALRSQRKSSEP